MQPTAATPGPIGLHRPEPATAASTPPVPGRRILHLTTEYPPVIFGGLGTAVGGWVRASAQQGLAVGVLLIDGALVVDESMTNLYGAPVARSAADLPASAVVDREGVMFVRAGRESAIETGVRITQ